MRYKITGSNGWRCPETQNKKGGSRSRSGEDWGMGEEMGWAESGSGVDLDGHMVPRMAVGSI